MSCGAEGTPHNQGFDSVELVGRKVRLRPTCAQDAPQAFSLIHENQDILKWLCWNGPKDKEELAQTYGTRWPEEMRAGTKYPFAIEEKDKPGLIGCIDARISKDPHEFEIGCWLSVPYWRRGYTSEAVALICYLCFQHLGAVVIHSGILVGNTASRRVHEKNGFVCDGTLRRYIHKGDNWQDLWHMSLLSEEWQARGFRPEYKRLIPHQEL